MRKLPVGPIRILAVVLLLVVGFGRLPIAAQNPITAAREAIRKAQEELKRKQEEAQKQKEAEEAKRKQAQGQQPAKPQAPPPAAAGASQPPSSTPGGTSEVVTLADLDKAAPAAPPAALDPTKMPDILGVHLGTPLQEALATLKSQYPKGRFEQWRHDPLGLQNPSPRDVTYAISINRYGQQAGTNEDQVNVSVTEHPNVQVVWGMGRLSGNQHVNRGTLLAALREKYGKETVAVSGASTGMDGDRTTDDRLITRMWWLYDEQGRRAPMPGGGMQTLYFCRHTAGAEESVAFAAAASNSQGGGWCSSYAGLHVQFEGGTGPIIENIRYDLIDVPLAIRSGKVTLDWKNAELAKLRQQEIERSKQNKPKL
jgi:Sec-independent protein translocase protein TatA